MFCLGFTPPIAEFGLSLLYVQAILWLSIVHAQLKRTHAVSIVFQYCHDVLPFFDVPQKTVFFMPVPDKYVFLHL